MNQHTPFNNHKYPHHDHARPLRPQRPQDAVLATTTVTIEKKEITVSRRANLKGEYIQITERSGHGYFNSVKIPSTGKEQIVIAIQSLFDDEPEPR